MINFGINSNSSELSAKLKGLTDSIQLSVHNALDNEIKNLVVNEVTDNNNWNPAAVYKSGNTGSPYDLDDSGQLMSTIKNPNYNTTRSSGGKVTLGVGNVDELDKLVSPRKGKNPDNRYWRLVVYGRAVIKGWRFVQRGETAKGKPEGYALKRSNSTIAKSEPTEMFERGMDAARGAIGGIISSKLKGVL